MGLVIVDETTYFSVTLDTNVVRNYPKNSLLMDRNDDRFILYNGANVPLQRFIAGDVTTPVHVAVVATGTFTVDTSITEGVHGGSTLTSDATNNTEDEDVTINTTVYRWRDTLAQAYDVKIGASAAASLDNLKAAINASGTAGVEYFAGTLAHPEFVATTNADTTQVIVSRTVGNTAATAIINAYVTEEGGAHTSWTGADIANGVAAVVPDTVTIGDVTYEFVSALSETSGADAVINQVLWVTNDATALDNFKLAINAGATEGTNYSTGTVVHPTVTATTNADASQVVAAKTAGNTANAIATTETGSTLSWGAATLTGGLDEADVLQTNLAAIIYA